MLAEIGELRLLRNLNDEAREKYKFLKNSMLSQKMGVVATMFHDLKVTSDALENAVEDAELTLSQEEKYGEFNYRLYNISDKFYKAIQTLDLNAANGGNTQFDEALQAYKEGNEAFLPGKFLREFKKFKENNPLVSWKVKCLNVCNPFFIFLKNEHFPSSCTPISGISSLFYFLQGDPELNTISRNLKAISKRVESLDNWFSGIQAFFIIIFHFNFF